VPRPLVSHGTSVETSNDRLVLLLSLVLVALTATPAPAPKPAPTNPFTLEPIQRPLPVIGVTRARPVCTAIRQAIAPAVKAAMKNDQLFGGFKGGVYDYTVKETESSRDLRLMQMDHGVQEMVKSVDALETAIKSPALDIPATASPDDAATLRKARETLQGVLHAQKDQLDAMSGFVETERMSRFGQMSETERAMTSATNPDMANQTSFTPGSQGAQSATGSSSQGGFLRDYNTVFKKNLNAGSMSITTARLLDHDLADMQAFTNKREAAATAVIVPAAQACSANATAPPAPLPSSAPVKPQG
jgi:hypothetical protein